MVIPKRINGLPVTTILFADDNRNIREYCRATLEEDGYRVLLACDGVEAIRVFSEHAPDLAILDICMPRSNGLEALDRIHSLAPQVPVILFTSYDSDCVQDPRAAFASACIGKGDDLTELKRVVAQTLRASSSEGRLPPLRLGLPPSKSVGRVGN